MITINTTVAAPKFPIWELRVPDIPFERDFFESNDLWENNKLVNGEYVSYGEERKEYKENLIPEFQNWYNTFKNENNILELLGDLFNEKENNEFFFKQYPIEDKGIVPSDFITRRCGVLYRIINDEPGYKMHNHFDNRAVFGNIFLNLTENKGVSTTFVNTFTNGNHSILDSETKIHYRAPDAKNEGIFFMNTSDTYHGIHNNTNRTRFIMNILIYFPELTF